MVFTPHVRGFCGSSRHNFRNIELKFCTFNDFNTANWPPSLKGKNFHGPDPEVRLGGGGKPSMAAQCRPRDPGAEAQCGPGAKLLNFKHLYRWNHAILSANQQNL